MATTITPQRLAGHRQNAWYLDPVWTPLDVAESRWDFVANERMFFIIENTDVTNTRNVTINSPASFRLARTGLAGTLVVPANEVAIGGPLTVDGFMAGTAGGVHALDNSFEFQENGVPPNDTTAALRLAGITPP